MSDLAQQIDTAQDLLDACSSTLTNEEYAVRNAKLYRARAPRVAYMTRMALIEEAVEGLGREEPAPLRALRHHVSGAVARGEAEPIVEQRGTHVVGGLRIGDEVLSHLRARAEDEGAESVVDGYIAAMDEKWGGPWDTIRPALVRLVEERS